MALTEKTRPMTPRWLNIGLLAELVAPFLAGENRDLGNWANACGRRAVDLLVWGHPVMVPTSIPQLRSDHPFLFAALVERKRMINALHLHPVAPVTLRARALSYLVDRNAQGKASFEAFVRHYDHRHTNTWVIPREVRAAVSRVYEMSTGRGIRVGTMQVHAAHGFIHVYSRKVVVCVVDIARALVHSSCRSGTTFGRVILLCRHRDVLLLEQGNGRSATGRPGRELFRSPLRGRNRCTRGFKRPSRRRLGPVRPVLQSSG